MQVHIKDIGGAIVKEDDRYTVKDNTTLRNLALSSTFLTAGKSTTGHAHVGQEEVYNFVRGTGKMEMIDLNGKQTQTTARRRRSVSVHGLAPSAHR